MCWLNFSLSHCFRKKDRQYCLLIFNFFTYKCFMYYLSSLKEEENNYIYNNFFLKAFKNLNTKNTQKPIFFEKLKKSFKNSKTSRIMPKLAIRPSTTGLHREAWFPPCFVRQNQQKTNFFLRGDFRPLPNTNVQFWDHFFPALFPKDFESLKLLDIRLRKVGAK